MSAVDALLTAGARVVADGLSPGTSGNISVRDGDRVLVSGSGTSLGRLGPDDVAVLDLDGRHLDGARPSKEWPLHLAFYARDPEHRAVVHVHSPYAVAASCLEPWSDASAVPPLTPYYVMRVGQTPLLPYRPPGDPGLGDDLRGCPWELRAALLANHGSVVAAADAAQACEMAVELEEACRIALLTTGLPRRELTPDATRELARRWASPWGGRTTVGSSRR
ncbi:MULTISPECIES: class II aldolase/adducin family protein [unclassified Pseudonocardia]|uniref:class II aldolase/adducin family protein n=1 Tax=unclassified Pseudonocardia TaxID=2619320 RepID=UPI0001FFF155|nr:class II aldolase/adducin family protein [Pseudonocardia sp. Ae707_Ps1]OLM18916.1 Ribulose-5-phosphate 4-epimerase [Pseudonocardia sp. Ae707_Ps1]